MGLLIGLAVCFGITYFISASETTKELRSTEKGGDFNNPLWVGGCVGGLLSLALVGLVMEYLFLNVIIGIGLGWCVKQIKGDETKDDG